MKVQKFIKLFFLDLQRDVKHYESGASSSNSKESCGGSLTSSPRSGISAARTSSGSDFQDDLEQRKYYFII